MRTKNIAFVIALLSGLAAQPLYTNSARPSNPASGTSSSRRETHTPGKALGRVRSAQAAQPQSPRYSTTPRQIVFEDGTFADSDWEEFFLLSQPGVGGTAATRRPGEGNPGPYRRLDIRLSPYPNAITLWSFNRRIGATFDPTLRGAITSINYSEDARCLSFCGMSGGQATGAALRQSGRIYFAQVSPFIPNAWTSIRRLGLQATNFAEIVVANGVGTLDQNRHPDFSASGAPIELAFIRAVSITPPGVFIETSAGIDNWRVTVNYAAPCDFSLAPASQAFSAIGGSGEIRLTTSSDCPWSATSDAAWITVSSATSGVGNGQVRFTVSPNAGAPRSGAIRIEDRIFTVSQADPASSCAFGVVWNSAHEFSAVGETGSITVSTQTGCPWTAATDVNWIVFLQGSETGIGNGQVRFAATTNTGPARTGTISVVNQNVRISQQAGSAECGLLSISPSAQLVPASGDSSVSVRVVNVPTTCQWTAVTNADWVGIPGGISAGSGSSVVQFRVSGNGGPPRSTTIYVAGQPFLLRQAGACSLAQYVFDPANVLLQCCFPPNLAAVAVVTVRVTAPPECAWTPIRSANDWISNVRAPGGNGSGTFSFDVAANFSDFERVGRVSAGPTWFLVTQLGLAVGPDREPDLPSWCVLLSVLRNKVLLLRAFRDSILAQTPLGREYSELYYRFSGEALRQALFHPTLLWRLRSVVDRQQPLIESMLNGQEAIATEADLDAIEGLLESFSVGASPEFAKALRRLKGDLRDPKVHSQFKVKVGVI